MVKVYFATNRRPEPEQDPTDFGTGFSAAGLASLRFGFAEVTGEDLDRYTLHVEPENLVKDAGRRQKDGEGSTLGSTAVFDRVRKKMVEKSRDTVIFIHGYNVSFTEALTGAATLKRNFGVDAGGPGVNVVLFSWPSDGSMMPYLAYANDRQDAAASGPAFARGFLKLVAFLRGSTPQEACDQRIHLVAHSMGIYVLRHAVQEIETQSPNRAPRIFDQVFLMAADEDADAFEHDHKLKPLPRLAKRVNVYFNNEDMAMAVSDKAKGNPDRLGDDGPRVPRGIPGKVTLIDCTPVVDGIFEHSYFLDTPTVVEDMQEVLAGTAPDMFDRRDYVPETNRYRLKNRK